MGNGKTQSQRGKVKKSRDQPQQEATTIPTVEIKREDSVTRPRAEVTQQKMKPHLVGTGTMEETQLLWDKMPCKAESPKRNTLASFSLPSCLPPTHTPVRTGGSALL